MNIKWPHWLNWLPFGKVPAVPAELLANKLDQYFILDVRTATEWNKSHIPGSHSIPLHRLSTTKISQLASDIPIVCVCLSAHRSKPATRKLLSAGLNAVELEGGMLCWWKHKLPTEKRS